MSSPLLMVQLIVLSTATGALSMWLYKLCSYQERLKSTVAELSDVQSKMMSYDGEFEGAQALMRESLKLSFLRLALVVVPSLMAAAPIIAVLTWGLGGFHDVVQISALNWGWASASEVLFLIVASLSALAVKAVFRIQC
ncbi:MAG: hypothetical protein KDA69_03525 [Planctomycetaceae bacterium]|nr:hypothetical protein [Planctomycetaceae bacterium]MCA9043362.1 hypothetical protein [Planctomycetaceae bacterium]